MPENRAARSPLRKESYGSVSVTWLDRRAARAAAEEAARELARAHPDVAGVLLFGSLVRGDAVPGSDVDLLVVLRRSELSFLERLGRYAVRVDGLNVDVFPYTEEEVHRLGRTPSLVSTALAEGVWIVGPPSGRSPGGE